MNQKPQAQTIVFYGTKEQVDLFVNNELDENGSFSVESVINGQPVEICVKTQRKDDEHGSYIKLEYVAEDRVAPLFAAYLMESTDYMKSIAKIRNFSERKETIFRYAEGSIQDYMEMTNVEYKNGRAYGEVSTAELFIKEVFKDNTLMTSFRWVGIPI
ncbi:hypothetical protein [Zwartia vadi]|uniref:hypothetical protein n=1 Tax=Zwartia vadi TaxID=3058168 RepID=UPI0025B3544D|nr:hypothetical protein [Zwartia vadi]MDN3988922.1 hypothetical protein [Zwartia vadi]